MSGKFWLQQKTVLQNRTEAGKELYLRTISDSHLFLSYKLPGLDINNMMSVNNYVCS